MFSTKPPGYTKTHKAPETGQPALGVAGHRQIMPTMEHNYVAAATLDSQRVVFFLRSQKVSSCVDNWPKHTCRYVQRAEDAITVLGLD